MKTLNEATIDDSYDMCDPAELANLSAYHEELSDYTEMARRIETEHLVRVAAIKA